MIFSRIVRLFVSLISTYVDNEMNLVVNFDQRVEKKEIKSLSTILGILLYPTGFT